ncbi:MAG: quinolinate synthase NadA [Leptospiraceae bacterium]|nr:quinolinate synthase NadA [Leptospiraceae bacterium]MDW8306893.1 quinolinate synthase NadA [Leptospiraceae bacterium]
MGALELTTAQRKETVRKLLEEYHVPSQEIEESLRLIEEIAELKAQKNAIALGHNYMTPDVFYGVSDYTGDSLELSRIAAQAKANILLFNGVHFMAETAKILSPEKKVLIADLDAGCSLAESITADDVRKLREQYPGIPIVSYINCSAEVKAEVDVICTSSNAVRIVESLPSDTVVLIPDVYLAGNVQKKTQKKIIPWHGKCMVHELYSVVDVHITRRYFPEATILAHPECKKEVAALVDFVGSTSQMIQYLKEHKPKQALLLTECSMTSNLRKEIPEVQFISMCQNCPHMKKITLRKIRDTLLYEKNEVDVSEPTRSRARKALERMLELSR